MPDDCGKEVGEPAIGNIGVLLEEELCSVTTSRVVFNRLHEVLGLHVLGGDLIGAGEELMHVAMNVGEGSKILSCEFRALPGLEYLVEVGLIQSTILTLGVNVALSEGDIHHTVHFIAEFGDVIRGKGVDELLR
jgi:hypothetical protein